MAPSSNHSELFENHVKDVEKDIIEEYPAGLEKKTVRRVDLHILPLFGLLYAVSVLDRINLGVARVAGMGTDLKLTVGDRYSIASCVYFIPYVLLQLPSNLIVQKIGPRIWLSICVVGWGAAQLGMGFVPQWGYLVLCRVFLGAFEAGLLPALVFVISTWYKRHEVQKRVAGFYLFSILIGGFGPIIGYALTLIAPRGGLNGWQWIFVIEGAITIAVGFFCYVVFPNFPDKNRFLSSEQTQLMLQRVEKDRGDSMPDKMTRKKLLLHLSDWKVWVFALMLMCATVPTYVTGYFIPIILSSMGYKVRDSLLLSAPPGVLAAFFCFVFAYISDRLRQRALLIAFQTILVIIGLALAAYTSGNGVRYFGLCLTTIGSCASVPGILSYSANNVVTHSKRAVSTAIIIAFAGIAGVFATTVFRQKDYPRYLNGIWAVMGCQFFLLVLLGVTTFTFLRRNRLAREGKMGPLEGQPGFYYTI